MKEKEFSINSSKIELKIRPDAGGAIVAMNYKKAGRPVKILRTAKEDQLKKEGGMAGSCFVMVPYSNRIREGAFVYWGIKRKVPKNHPKTDDPVNGDGWNKVWKVESASDSKICMSYRHNGENGFPYKYTATQVIEVKDNTVRITMSIMNNYELPMPCGMGLLPYFVRTDDVYVKCKNRMVWSHETLPPISKPYKTPKDWSFEDGRELGDLELDTCFGGFDGKAEVRYPKEGVCVRVNADESFNHVIIHSPAGENFFCVEPSTNANDAFNLAAKGIIGSGIQTLEPEENMSAAIEITVSDI